MLKKVLDNPLGAKNLIRTFPVHPALAGTKALISACTDLFGLALIVYCYTLAFIQRVNNLQN